MLVVTDGPTDQGTRSPIELFWTAKNQLKYEAKVDIKKIVLNSKTIMMYCGSKKTYNNKFEPKILAENTDNHVSSIVKDDSVPVNKVVVASPAFVKSTSARKLDSKTCDI